MDKCTTLELRDKEIINICSGARLGYATDFEFNICDGRILAIIVAGNCGFFGFGKNDDIYIQWDKIECIGDDTILVRVADIQACCFQGGAKGRKKH